MFAKETHVLVVDDSANIRKIVVESLAQLGFKNVSTAESADEAWDKLHDAKTSVRPFGLILSDLNMPGRNGLELLKLVRAERRLKNLPFVLVTTDSERALVVNAIGAGVSSYVVKPFDVETLLKKLENAWVKHHPPVMA